MTTRDSDPGFEALLEFLKRSRGFDLTGYKRAGLERRFRRRLQAVGVSSYGDYLDHLEVHPQEFAELFNTLLINVTSFFRDEEAWRALREDVLPPLIERRRDGPPLRVWSAGCASGQEAYSIAMTLAEILGPEEYRKRVKIYGTDIDEEALASARTAVYTAKELDDVPEQLRSKYFEPSETRFAFRNDLRRTVIFGRNHLLEDAPIGRLDLLVCRNTLMYFTAEAQARILRNFHFALGEGAALMLGTSETMLFHRDAYTPVNLGQRIFRKDGRRSSLQARVTGPDGADHLDVPPAEDERLSRDAALEIGGHAQLIVSRSGLLTFANLTARTLFGLSVEQFGAPFQELEVSYQPAELRAPVDEALRERRRVALGEVAMQPATGEERRLDICVTPLLSNGSTPLGVLIEFEDVTRLAAVQRELDADRRDLELAYEELRSTIEELETTNEELQSANEELEAINDELRDRAGELNRVNEFLEAILTALGLAVAVVDREQRVQVWNDHAEDLWGVRQDEAVDRRFLELDIGLPTEQLAPALRSALSGADGRTQLELEAVNRRGRPIVCHTTVVPLAHPADGDGNDVVHGAIVLMDDAGRPEE